MKRKTLLFSIILTIILFMFYNNKTPYTKSTLIKENKDATFCNTNTISFSEVDNKYNIKVEEYPYTVIIFMVNTKGIEIKKYNLGNILKSHKLNDYSNKFSKVVKKIEEYTSNERNIIIDYPKYFNDSIEYDYLVIDVIVKKKSSTCYSRKIKQIPIFSSSNPYTNLCNSKLEDIEKLDDKDEEEYKHYKENLSLCKKDNPLNVAENDFLESLNNARLNFIEYTKINNSKSLENKEIGNKDFYENIDNTKNVPLLTCKVNSVYLKDVTKEDKLENNTDGLSLKLSDKEIIEAPKPNLYEFKHTEVNSYNYKIYEKEKPKEEKTACEVSCTEYLKINFAPPQNVKAGMCFSYATSIISTTECNVKASSPPDVEYASIPEPPLIQPFERRRKESVVLGDSGKQHPVWTLFFHTNKGKNINKTWIFKQFYTAYWSS